VRVERRPTGIDGEKSSSRGAICGPAVSWSFGRLYGRRSVARGRTESGPLASACDLFAEAGSDVPGDPEEYGKELRKHRPDTLSPTKAVQVALLVDKGPGKAQGRRLGACRKLQVDHRPLRHGGRSLEGTKG